MHEPYERLYNSGTAYASNIINADDCIVLAYTDIVLYSCFHTVYDCCAKCSHAVFHMYIKLRKCRQYSYIITNRRCTCIQLIRVDRMGKGYKVMRGSRAIAWTASGRPHTSPSHMPKRFSACDEIDMCQMETSIIKPMVVSHNAVIYR